MLFRELSYVRRYDCMNYLETIDCHYLLNDHRLQLRLLATQSAIRSS